MTSRAYWSRRYWATVRKGGTMPCLWSTRKRDAVENCCPDERVVQVRVTVIKYDRIKSKRAENGS